MTADERNRLAEGASSLGAPLGEAELDRFARYLALLREWNARMNLTRVPWEEAVSRHFLDSLSIAKAINLRQAAKLLDVGSGAGFPGVPLAIAFSGLEVTLLDATRKRVAFLQAVLDDLELRNARANHARAEELCLDPRRRASYDVVVARALAPCDRLVGWCLPFVKSSGVAIAIKSAGARDEIERSRSAATAHGGALESVVEVEIPHLGATRLLAVYRKVSLGADPSRSNVRSARRLARRPRA